MPVAIEHELIQSVNWPHESLKDSHEDGCTEPWIAELLCALVKASDSRAILETGGFQGTTSAWLALTLQQMGGGSLFVAEVDDVRQRLIIDRLYALGDLLSDAVKWSVSPLDALQLIGLLKPHSLDFAFVDDDHHPVHVEQEILALWKKVRPGGIIAFHDVVGSTAEIGRLVKKYGGVVLDLPRLGPGGGLGVLQIPK